MLLTACGHVDGRLKAAGQQAGKVRAERLLPDYPDDCRKEELSGVRLGDPLDLALLKTDHALGRANARGRRCARWYDGIKTGFEGGGA